MAKYLFVAEKPSLRRAVENCYHKHETEVISKLGELGFVDLHGHACGLVFPNEYEEWRDVSWYDIQYPMVPSTYIYCAKQGSENLLKEIKDGSKTYDGIIVGTDSDVEGYGIYNNIEIYLGITDVKALRFINHSMTDVDILKALLSMTDYHNDPIHARSVKAFQLRSRADWLYGMNISRMLSNTMGYTNHVGRVQSPTLKLVYDNSMQIENFKPQKYYVVKGEYEGFSADMIDADENILKFRERQDVSDIPLDGKVTYKETENKKIHAPKLYDLASLQVEAGKTFSLNPDEVLTIIQSLYETHRILSYPRTQCRYISKEKAKEFKDLLSKTAVFPELKPYVDKITDEDIVRVQNDTNVVNDKEVEKESHDALLPTDETPDLSKLSDVEYKICLFIYKRLVAQFLPMLSENNTKMIITHGDKRFLAKGKTVLTQGWRVLYSEQKGVELPDINRDESISVKFFTCEDKVTKAPKRLTQPDLITAMTNIASKIEDKELKDSLAESKGIGTQSTRHTIIKNIIENGYVRDEKKKGLFITDKGKAYIEVMKDIKMIDPVFAAILDMNIKHVQNGDMEYDEAYENTIKDLKFVCNQMEHLEAPKSMYTEYLCKKCGAPLLSNPERYICSKRCGFKINKTICGKQITTELMNELYEKGITERYNLKKKTGDRFTARFILTEEGVGMDFGNEFKCRFCGSDINISEKSYWCSNKECGMSVYKTTFGRTITEKLFAQLMEDGELPEYEGYVKKDGTKFKSKARLVFGEDRHLMPVFQNFEVKEMPCPYCGELLKINKGGWFCDCGLKIYRHFSGREFANEDIEQLFEDGYLPRQKYTKKNGDTFEAALILNDETKTVEFGREPD